ncbi:uncharacterized protein LOC119838137 [Zerene cesonia]|uniref:uncharacterized protein LOC119838137 n=1 Tax=Zerene cesonia TaxID=33412 RepID=UPI0018E59C96|nr:uncharacterized protein LOC119838137 [Zerene cesonia]
MFLETLDPFPGMDDNEVTNYLYAKSLEIEPRPPAKPTPKFPRKYPELSVKPVKISRRSHDHHHSTTSISSSEDSMSVAQLSPTSTCTWDGASLASLPIHHDDRSDRSLTSPRLERSSSSSLAQLGQLSLFDKLAFFDKSKSVATLNANSRNSMSARDEPPSPRDNHSPRHDRCNSTSSVGAMGPLSTGSSGTVGRSSRGALSPRPAIVDAELFYSRSMDHLACRRQEQVSGRDTCLCVYIYLFIMLYCTKQKVNLIQNNDSMMFRTKGVLIARQQSLPGNLVGKDV